MFVLLATNAAAHAQLAVYQQPRSTGHYDAWFSSAKPDGTSKLVLDNFVLGATADIAIVNWQGVYVDGSNPTLNPAAPDTSSFVISFWSDASGKPGNMIASQTIAYSSTNATFLHELSNFDLGFSGTYVTVPEYSFSAKLTNPFPAAAGVTYWIGIQSVCSASEPGWSWISGNGPDMLCYQQTASGLQELANDRCFTLALAHPAFFNGEADLGAGAYYLSFSDGNYFGYYSYLTDPDYVYHFDLGYEYLFDAKDSKGGLYLYDFQSNGFFYTSPIFPFPYLYDFSLNSVVYYYPDPNSAGHYNTNGIRYFYVFNTGKIISK